MVTVQLAVADATGVIPEGKEYRIVLGAGQAIAAIEEVIMELAPGGSGRAPGEVARRLSRRGAARQDEDGARLAEGREAQVAAGARRRARARGG